MIKPTVPIDKRVTDALDKYYLLGGTRKRAGLEVFLNVGLEYTTLSSVDAELKTEAINAKHYFIMWNAFIDDVVDTHKNKQLTMALLSSAFVKKDDDLNKIDQKDKEWFLAYCDIWQKFKAFVKKFPRFSEFEEILFYDIRQFLNCIRYSFLILDYPQLINLNEHELYISHNMNLVIFSTIDLMCSSGFNPADLSTLRRIIWEGQYMTRIDNDIITWERETSQGDFSSSIFAVAIEKKVIDYREIDVNNYHNNVDTIISKIKNSDVIEEMTQNWKRRKENITALSHDCKSLDIMAYLKGIENLHELYKKSKNIV
ncbi:MAG: hypothetical protein GY754_05565 [bacterium]|nr:hypothetical protein [bacterium]